MEEKETFIFEFIRFSEFIQLFNNSLMHVYINKLFLIIFVILRRFELTYYTIRILNKFYYWEILIFSVIKCIYVLVNSILKQDYSN